MHVCMCVRGCVHCVDVIYASMRACMRVIQSAGVSCINVCAWILAGMHACMHGMYAIHVVHACMHVHV